MSMSPPLRRVHDPENDEVWVLGPLPPPLEPRPDEMRRLPKWVHPWLWTALHHAIRSEDNATIVQLVPEILPGMYRPTDGDGNENNPTKVNVSGPLGALVGTLYPAITTYRELRFHTGALRDVRYPVREILSPLYPRITDHYLGYLISESGMIRYRAEKALVNMHVPGSRRRLAATQFLSRVGRMRAAESVAGTQRSTPDPIAAVVVASGWRHLHDHTRAIDVVSGLIGREENLPAALTIRAGAYGDIREFRKAHADATRAWRLEKNPYIAYALIRASEAVGDEASVESAWAYLSLPTTPHPM
jgi:hypothetical protein